MRALVLNCTLKPSPAKSNTEALARVVMEALEGYGLETELVRVVDHDVKPGVSSDEGQGDEWPGIRAKLLAAEILVFASPTWLGGRRASRSVVTGNEDGAHHVISEIAGALIDVGYAIPGQAWTYWNRGPGPGDSYLDSDEGQEWSHKTGRAAASNLVAVARALAERPVPPPS